ncbi:hypothetical protein GCM10022251_42100 [Phytohabitans flavus]|uniref:Uncharacterized protein n=1 Tax=Phytohabitans flavus TaxID=1076124 RepID=A0A6F8Y0E1_9ACTN|nr:hypothetical protein Pflav_059550 [Phytohabitans flavus]
MRVRHLAILGLLSSWREAGRAGDQRESYLGTPGSTHEAMTECASVL